MNWMTVLWPMVIAACLTLALINLRIALGDVRRAPHVFFFISALAVATVSALELAILRSDDLAQCQSLLRWSSVPLAAMVTSVAGFVWSFFGTGRAWLALTGGGFLVAAEIANLVSAVPAVRNAVALRQGETFGGVRFTAPVVVEGRWSIVELIGVVIVVVFVFDASVALWKSGGRRCAVIVGGSIIFFFMASRGHAMLVEKGIVQTPYFVSIAFLVVIVAMGHELGNDVFRSAKLSRDLRESERRMDLAARATALGFWTWDVARDEIWATANARLIFGFSETERLTRDRFMSLLHPEDCGMVRQAIEKSLIGDGDYETEYRVPLPDGPTRWIAARGRMEFSADGKPALMRGVVRDITERKRAEEETQRHRQELAHVARVSIMGELSASMAHELNQPLTAILANAQAAQRFMASGTADMDEFREILKDIAYDTTRARDVIRHLRALVKKSEPDFARLDIGETIREVVGFLHGDIVARNVRVILELAPDLPPVHGDRIQLQQVLINLLLNAFDALNGNPVSDRLVTVTTTLESPQTIRVSVQDSGVGLPLDKLESIFEPFYTTKREGMGMGLSVTRSIIESHRGRITAENNPDRGAVFHFRLPVAEPA